MRVGIVDDTMVVVEGLRIILEESGLHQVAWTASNGVEAVEQCNNDTPDLVLMDLIMPIMEGVEATRLIMASSPCPILIVTSSVTKYAPQVFSAMGFGALDAVNLPSIAANPGSPNSSREEFLSKIATINKLTAKIQPVKQRQHITRTQKTPIKRISSVPTNPLVVIGSSAGGPQVLQTILSRLPANFPAPIVVVQHIDAQFSEDMGAWLDTHCALSVRIASTAEQLEAGAVLLGGRDEHIVINRSQYLTYTSEPSSIAYRPSVDVFFQSVLKYWKGDVTAILLTGMGRDGAQGLLDCKERGFYTIAQDEDSCAVYGMPMAAAKLNAAVDILPPSKIAEKLISLYCQSVRERML